MTLSARELIAKDSDSGPWAPDHRLAFLAANVVGLVLIVASWWGTSGSGNQHHQIVWLNAALLAVIIAAVGNGLYLLRGYRSIRYARAEIFSGGMPAEARTRGSATKSVDSRLVHVAGTTRFHYADCSLVQGKTTTEAARSRHERAGLVPCEVCQP